MADYFPLISRAVTALSPNSREARESIYARAREALSRQLQSLDPPIPDADLWRERDALEETIRRIESQFPATVRSEARPVVPPPPAVAPAALQPVSMPAAPERAATIAATIAAPLAPEPAPTAGAIRRTPAFKLPQRQPGGPAASPAPPVAADGATGAEIAVTPVSPGQPAAAPDTQAEGSQVEAPRAEPTNADDATIDLHVRRPKVEARDTAQAYGRRMTALLIALPAMLGLGALAYVLRDDPAIYGPRESDPPAADPAVPARKADSRLDGTAPTAPASGPRPNPVSSVPALPVAARALFLEETANDPRGLQHDGQVIWRLETPTASGQPTDPAVRASIAFPNARMGLEMVFKRNRDAALPASHTVELVFRPEGDRDGVVEIGPIEARDQETQPGYQLRGAMVPVGVNLFLVGLDRSPPVAEKNVEAMRDHRFFAFQFRLANGRVGAVLIEKGTAGDRVFREATDIWRRG